MANGLLTSVIMRFGLPKKADFFFEENDFGDLEYDMWEGQFHLVSAPPPGENSQTSSISEELVSEDVNQILESLDRLFSFFAIQSAFYTYLLP